MILPQIKGEMIGNTREISFSSLTKTVAPLFVSFGLGYLFYSHMMLQRKLKRETQEILSEPQEHINPSARRTLIATRIHLNKAKQTENFKYDEAPLMKFLQTMNKLLMPEDICLIVVDIGTDIYHPRLVVAVEDIIRKFNNDTKNGSSSKVENVNQFQVLPVSPWGQFVPALNAVVGYAKSYEFDCILFASLEINLSSEDYHYLHRKMNLETDLVVGAALQGHNYISKEVSYKNDNIINLDGRTTPWNTLALWSVSFLGKTGFLYVSEGEGIDGIGGGVEEVVTIALQQKIFDDVHKTKYPYSKIKTNGKMKYPRAILLKLPQTEWNVRFDDEGRKTWHENKMKSKLSRAHKQLKQLDLVEYGKVLHI